MTVPAAPRRRVRLSIQPGCCSVSLKPIDSLAQAVLQARFGAEADQLGGSADVQTPARLAVGLARVPHDSAFEAGDLRDQFGELADRDLAAIAEVHRLRRLVLLQRQDQAFGTILHIEELA